MDHEQHHLVVDDVRLVKGEQEIRVDQIPGRHGQGHGIQRPPSDVRRKVSCLGRQKSRVRRIRSRRASARRIVVNSSRILIECKS